MKVYGKLLKKYIVDSIYPVGSIYMSTSSTSPATLFGGTWTAWGAGKVPVGINTSDTDFATVEKTGGAKTVTLTSSQIPSHSHGVGTIAGASAGAHTHTMSGSTAATGSGGSHTNLQPYIVCYMWKRTA
jgi:microcystin-dependent protein